MAAEFMATDFVMQGARAAMAAGLSHIEEQVKGIERAVGENPGLAFDLARTVVESVCRTILTERKIAYDPDDDLPRLFKSVTTSLPMLPPAASSAAEARKSLVQTLNGLNTALQGVCELRNGYGFASHGADGARPAMEGVQALLVKKMAGYHQFHAVNVALEETLRASILASTYGPGAAEEGGHYASGTVPGGAKGDRRVGVVWHTQGSGKSLTMAFYAGRAILAPEMANPTNVVLTDRNDLDDQLFGTFARCRERLRQPPVQAEDRAYLRKKRAEGPSGARRSLDKSHELSRPRAASKANDHSVSYPCGLFAHAHYGARLDPAVLLLDGRGLGQVRRRRGGGHRPAVT
jgi:hypothetical protein